jgi:transcriptional regulator with XRE-family HTH domain
MDTLSQRARLLREHAGIGQREADRRAGVWRGLSGAIERGEVKVPDAVSLLALCTLYGVSLEWLLKGKGDAPDARAVAIAAANCLADSREAQS